MRKFLIAACLTVPTVSVADEPTASDVQRVEAAPDDDAEPATAATSSERPTELEMTEETPSEAPEPRYRDWRAGVYANAGIVYGGPGGGVSGTFILNRAWSIDAALLSGRVEIDDDFDNPDSSSTDDHSEIFQLSLVEVSGHARWTPAYEMLPSFSVFAGLGLASGQGEYGYRVERSLFLDDDEVTDDFTAFAVLPQIGVSNIWRIGPGFTIGAHWLSISIPFVAEQGFDADSIKTSAETDGVDFDNELDKRLAESFIVKSLFVVGWTF